tara:strand:- start:603 stop:920 length:318 start_codon:yes stop_codon:yes gene_type:complete
MLFKAIKKALADGMEVPEVKEVLRKCGYELIVKTKVNDDLLRIMFIDPELEANGGDALPPPDGAAFFDSATKSEALYRRATVRKLSNPNFVSAMALLGSPLEGRR